MEWLLVFRSSVLPIFLIVALAFVYQRLARPDISSLANLAMSLFAPIVIFDTLYSHRLQPEKLADPLVFMVVLTVVLMAASYLTAKLAGAGSDDLVSFVLSCSMVNVGNFGLPLIFFAYGEPAEPYAALYFAVFSVPLSTVAIYLSSKERNLRRVLVDILKIPIFHALVLALILSSMSVSLPQSVEKSVGLLADAGVPLLIFILGLKLATIEVKLGFWRLILLAVCLRLIVSPIISYYTFDLMGSTGVARQVGIVQTSAPSALLPLMYAIRFNRSPDLLAAIILATTLFSGVSLTVLIKLIGS
jgi:hypothetical protein